MKKRNLLALFAFLTLAVVIGCGGGGGGGGNGSGDGGDDGGSGGGITRIVLEAVLASNPNTFVDPANIQVGESIQFQVAGYTAAGARSVLAAGPFTTTDTTNTVGTLSSAGLFNATASSNTQFTVSTFSNGATRTRNYLVKPVQALVSGTVLDSNGRAVYDALVRIINNSNLIVATGRTGVDGRFRISTPTTGATINIDPVTLPETTYYKSFILNSKRYTTLDVDCSAPLPALGIGSSVGVGTLVVDTVRNIGGGINVPPPPPDGCS